MDVYVSRSNSLKDHPALRAPLLDQGGVVCRVGQQYLAYAEQSTRLDKLLVACHTFSVRGPVCGQCYLLCGKLSSQSQAQPQGVGLLQVVANKKRNSAKKKNLKFYKTKPPSLLESIKQSRK
jgi:hypothetical protein